MLTGIDTPQILLRIEQEVMLHARYEIFAWTSCIINFVL